MPDRQQIQLQKEIDNKRAEIRSEQYSISIGEIVSMYVNNEIDIHPEFQRFFRWDVDRKSRFVESVFLGIPIPSLFVAQKGDGKWDVIDGLQRLSTIFQLMGILKNENGTLVAPLELTRTKYLPSMEGMKWDVVEGEVGLSMAQKLFVKRSKLDFKIILPESSDIAKFELFHRLNTGGAELSDQEIRNSMLVSANREMYAWLKSMADDLNFQQCVSLTERSTLEQYDIELVLRFLLLKDLTLEEQKTIGDLGEFLTEKMIEKANTFERWRDRETKIFQKTLSVIAESLGDDAFRKYDAQKNRYIGGFSISVFEVIALGIGHALGLEKTINGEAVVGESKRIIGDAEFASSAGVRASTRIPKTIELGRAAFAR